MGILKDCMAITRTSKSKKCQGDPLLTQWGYYEMIIQTKDIEQIRANKKNREKTKEKIKKTLFNH